MWHSLPANHLLQIQLISLEVGSKTHRPCPLHSSQSCLSAKNKEMIRKIYNAGNKNEKSNVLPRQVRPSSSESMKPGRHWQR